jgi:hypothetical protein
MPGRGAGFPRLRATLPRPRLADRRTRPGRHHPHAEDGNVRAIRLGEPRSRRGLCKRRRSGAAKLRGAKWEVFFPSFASPPPPPHPISQPVDPRPPLPPTLSSHTHSRFRTCPPSPPHPPHPPPIRRHVLILLFFSSIFPLPSGGTRSTSL